MEPEPDAIPEPSAPPVVVGWVLAGGLNDAQRRAVALARKLVRDELRRALPQFDWRLPSVRRRDVVPGARAEPVDLLDIGAAERDLGEWDFALVVTAADLRARFRPFALGTPSQALGVAVLSVARLDPTLRDASPDPDRLADRVATLALHELGHLNGLVHRTDPDDLMHDIKAPADLDGMLTYSADEIAELADELADVADPRMEERSGSQRLSGAAFAVRALWSERADVVDAVRQIRPWRFPFQFSKLTTAAVSTLVVLVMTAEAWDLGARQPAVLVIALSVAVLVGASVYLVRKQRLLVHRRSRKRSEQRVVAEASVLLAVGIGMATTYAILFLATLALSLLLFDRAILEGWAATLGETIAAGHIVVFAAFVATIGLAVGGLGASFEEQTYFRHVALVDEET
ncbi:MAG: DUF2391 domain-containing protein [Bacteroidota bacterium]